MRILVAEDERDLNRILVKKLTGEGYSVDACFDGAEALDYMALASYDGIVLDIMMPNVDGYQVVESLRQRGNATPVLLLTARDSIADRVKGLDLGASDYLIKPFSFEELMARIRAMTRKAAGSQSNRYTVGDLTVDASAHTAQRGGDIIPLSAKEFALLELLIRNKGRVLSRGSIENSLWNFDYEGGTNVVDVYIRYLRKKLDDGHEKKLIHTVRGSGYTLREEP